MNLVIVESPTKKKTIQKYLGKDYKVEASVGHIRDISMTGKYSLGLDIDSGNFEVNWEINKGKEKVVKHLVELKENCENVYLATDPDREGEAIAWHLAQVLNIDPKDAKRLEFHEITKHAILDSLENVRSINMNTYHAQETRRIMDRIIGFRLSYIVQQQAYCDSAGRVQSVVLKFIYKNDLIHRNFISQNYYHLKGFINDLKNKEICLNYVDDEGKIIDIFDKNEALKTLDDFKDKAKLINLKEEEKEIKSGAPFTMSKLFQKASSLYKYSTTASTFYLKCLFENGFITYPRTDSIRINPEFINKIKEYIKTNFGEEYVGVAKIQGSKNGVADAHEALRPTDLNMDSATIYEFFKKDKKTAKSASGIRNIYDLIFAQAIQSIMAPRKEHLYVYTFDANGHKLGFTNSKCIFKGFSKYANKKEPDFYDLDLEIGSEVELIKKEYEELETKPASYYTEGSLVKKMEDTGIGRPSTYASTIENLYDKGYITKNQSSILITDHGIKLCKYLEKNFPQTIKTEYTAELEAMLDQIEKGEKEEKEILTLANDNFLKEFQYMLDHPDKIEPEKTGELCPLCGHELIHVERRNLKFIGCSNYPACSYIKPEYTGELCPECGKPLVYRVGKQGNKFVACTGYPSCTYHVFPKPTVKKYYRKSIKK